MQRIEIGKAISKDLGKNWVSQLEDANLYKLFEPIYKLTFSIETLNSIVAYCILAYDNESQWIDIRKDRYENKYKILKSLDCDIESEIFEEILRNGNEIINDVILHYLSELTDWRWQTVFTLLDYHANMIRFVNQKTDAEKTFNKLNKEGDVKTLTEDYDIDTITKVNKQKGELLDQAIQSREKADKLLMEIRKDFVSTDTAVQADFGFSFSDTSKKKIDIYSWKDFIASRNQRKQRKQVIS